MVESDYSLWGSLGRLPRGGENLMECEIWI